jgi:hypothetical protein
MVVAPPAFGAVAQDGRKEGNENDEEHLLSAYRLGKIFFFRRK